MQINFGARSVSCKIVYYGPGMSGKTTNIQKVHELTPGASKSDLTSIKTEGDRTLFFDFMSLDLGKVAGMDTRFQLYTVPGQVYYNATRKLVLSGADGIVFVADSAPDRLEANVESWADLKDNLAERGMSLKDVPVVIQWNKRDVPNAVPVPDLDREINVIGAPTFEGVACNGDGVLETLKCVCAMVCKTLNSKQLKAASEERPRAASAPAATLAASTASSGVGAQSMSFARRVGASAAGASASAVMDPPAATTTAGAATAAKPSSRVPVSPASAPMPPAPNAPTPPQAKARAVEAVATATSAARPAWTTKDIVLVAAGVAAAIATAALGAAWMLGAF